MQFSITQKLVLAFLSLTLLVLIATLGLTRWSFERGFLDYVNTQEQARLEAVRDSLAREYELLGGNWESMTPARFEELVVGSVPGLDDQLALGRPTGPPTSPPPGPPGRPGEFRGERPLPDHPIGQRTPPTTLYDRFNRQIAGVELGESSTDLVRIPVVVDGETIGELRSEISHRISSPQDTAFSRQQLNMKWAIGISSMILAAALSIALARGLLAPVRRMIKDVARLSDGDYSARLQENRNDELGQLMADLDHLGFTLEEERSSRRQWLADISHELKTPLTVLSGELEALRDGVRSFDSEQVDSLDQEVQRLRFLVDDLYELSVSDVGGLRYTFSKCNLRDCLESVVGATRNRAADNGLELEIRGTEKISINGDINRIDQLFQNLFDNSIAYTDAPGRIEVTLSMTNGTAIVEIHDTPPGASQAECERLFEPLFRREASRNRRMGGAGLGLSICRNIVEAHRGTIVAAPSPLGGLCIRIEIPTVREATE